ncbi:MAG TPA: UDP-N-acetylmuramoyl-L-alanyl-D-glutamate--2,6-diaminopimelate ligase [Actinomycetaceae bacterium]|nr:UDP-N-acetylmuramoyl-L-alanyl-D-glutamate--2,6-diaminopimelate ligase [Actinomycetaceae bacterium]
MLLSELAHAIGSAAPTGAARVEIRGVTHNAGWAEPGDAFVAIRGARVDGHTFADDAARRGAIAVIGEGPPEGWTTPLPYILVDDARAALADAAAVLAGDPSKRLDVVGVTGTDGKTTTSWIIRYLLRAAGRATGLLSTVGYELPDGVLRQFPQHFTTPEAPQVQELLSTMADSGADAVVLEASSHALALDRVRAVSWDVAVWTQLTREHLDFHGDMDEYFATKRALVERSPFAVLNADDPWSDRLRGVAPAETTYGQAEAPAEWHARDVVEAVTGLEFALTCPDGEFAVRLPMLGRFNVSNALAALAAVHRLGVGAAEAVEALAAFPGVPGRMQLLPATDLHVVVDFAHTPGSLQKALAALREVAPAELWVVVGAVGGNRDPGKRAPMGEAAARLADRAVFTEDDPRDTPLAEILAEMERGAAAAGRHNYVSVPDRGEAIRHAISEAAPGAVVLLAGKGPEDFILRFDREDPWDETEVATAALAARAAPAAGAEHATSRPPASRGDAGSHP